MLVRVLAVGCTQSALSRARAEFPSLDLQAASAADPKVQAADTHIMWCRGASWLPPDEEARVCEALAGPRAATLAVTGDDVATALPAILTRLQRFLGRRNPSSQGVVFERLLERHRQLHDLAKPLVRADFDHALDTWQWMLRLDGSAGFAPQAAALLHDVERLASEADARTEQHARDYQAFKDAHAREGAQMARALLAELELSPTVIAHVVRLIEKHERPGGDPELDLVNDADALSFFSLNSAGFLDYFGEAHTRKKVAWSWRRLRASARQRLGEVLLRPDVKHILEEELVRDDAR